MTPYPLSRGRIERWSTHSFAPSCSGRHSSSITTSCNRPNLHCLTRACSCFRAGLRLAAPSPGSHPAGLGGLIGRSFLARFAPSRNAAARWFEREAVRYVHAQVQSQCVLEGIDRLSQSRLHIAFGSGYTSSDVRAYALQVQAAEGIKPALIVVDYVQLLKDQEGDGRIRERNVSAAARGLKDVSGELGVPVLALVQLNRNRATRIDKRPQLADLRESGDLENTADSVLGLYRDEIERADSNDRGLAELIVLKKRQLGEDVGTVRRLVWSGESYRDLTCQS